MAQLVKNTPAMQETPVQSLGWEDLLKKGKGYPLQHSSLENSMDCIVHGVAKSRTWLSNFHLATKRQQQNEGKEEENFVIKLWKSFFFLIIIQLTIQMLE